MTQDLHLEHLREEYTFPPLLDDAPLDPWALFSLWMSEAEARGLPINEVTLSTASALGVPSARVVLIKSVSPKEGNFNFYTDYRSRKGQDLLENPQACVLYYWPSLRRQILVGGSVSKLSVEENARYFSSRPRESQVSALLSVQSGEGPLREAMHEAFSALLEKLSGQEIACPSHWGGYALKASRFEFWQGGPYRLHDRLEYVLEGGRFQRARLWS